MAALAADVNASTEGLVQTVPLSANAADTYYRGSIVWWDTGGGVQLATFAGGDRVAGVSPKQQIVAAAGQLVDVLRHGYVWLPVGASVTAAHEGELLVFDADGTVSDNPADATALSLLTQAASDAVVGRIMRVTATQMLIELGPNTGQISLGAIDTAGFGG